MICQLAKEGHKLASLEKASVLAASDDPKDQDKAREIKTRFDYESLKRQIGSKKKPSKPAVNETTMPNVSSNDKKAIKSRAKNLFKRDLKGEHDGVNEAVGAGVPLTPQELEIQKKMSRLNVRLARKRNQEMQKAKTKDTESSPEQVKEGDVHSGQGEKIQKRTKAWMDKKGQKGAPGLDAMRARAAEHKAKRGVKEEVVDEAKVDKGRSDYGKATIRNWRHSGPSTVEPAMFDPENKRGKTIDKRREEHKARRGVKGAKVPTYKKEEVELDEAERKLADRLARKRKLYDKTLKKAMQFARDEGEASGHARYRMGSIDREMDGIRAKMKKEEVVIERLGGKGYKPYTSLTGKKVSGDWEDSDRGAGNKAKKRAGGKVEKKSPTYRAYVLNKEEVSIMEEDKAFNTVVAALRKKHGKDAILTKDSPKPKPPSEAQKKKSAAERKKRQDADNKAYASRAKKAGFKSTQDYTDVVARYGSEDNYRKGKGLGT